MENLLVGLVGYRATADLGLPDGYGFFCVLTGALLVLVAACFLQEVSESDCVVEDSEACVPEM
ncbi:MAG: hypothetical protein ABIJ96_15085 [Elusimicrobiota bacterium]